MIIATTSAQHLDPDDHRATADRGLKLPKDAGHHKNQHRSGRIKRHRPHPRPITPRVVLADAGCGADMKFQAGLLDFALSYVPVCRSEAPKIRHDKPDLRRDAAAGGDALDVQPNSSVWPDGEGTLPTKAWSGQGRPPTRLQRSDDHQPVSAKDLALSLPASAWQEATCRSIGRAGVKGDLVSRIAAKRIRPAHRDDEHDEPWPELWLLIEWPDDEAEPSKFWFANLPADTDLDNFVRLAKLRWRIERDYLELKQELGLGHYEGRGWRGFHHDASLCIAACGFLIAERLTSSPKGGSGKPRFRLPKQPKSFKPRGAPDRARTSHRPFHCHHAMAHHHRTRPKTLAMSLLLTEEKLIKSTQFMTQ